MKNHFDKEITERPRRGGGDTYGKFRSVDRQRLRDEGYSDDYEDRGQSKMRKIYGWERKEFNDHLSPVRRWLRKQAGRPWNKVWSEVCQLNLGGVLGQHIRDHIFRSDGGGMVAAYSEILLRREQSKKYGRYGSYGHHDRFAYGYDGLWIDQHGMLRYNEQPRQYHRRGVKEELPYIKINDHSWYAKESGLWFRFSGIDPYPEITHVDNLWSHKSEKRVTGEYLYRRVDKQSLNRKELNKLGFSNDPPSLEKLPKVHSLRVRPWRMGSKEWSQAIEAQKAADARAAISEREKLK
jgi:hypothetical protein